VCWPTSCATGLQKRNIQPIHSASDASCTCNKKKKKKYATQLKKKRKEKRFLEVEVGDINPFLEWGKQQRLQGQTRYHTWSQQQQQQQQQQKPPRRTAEHKKAEKKTHSS